MKKHWAWHCKLNEWSKFREWICRKREAKPWGFYCAFLSSHDQKKIIFREIKVKNDESTPNPNSKYAINSAWWYQWCDFVNVSVDEITKHQKMIKEKEEKDKSNQLVDSRDASNLK